MQGPEGRPRRRRWRCRALMAMLLAVAYVVGVPEAQAARPPTALGGMLAYRSKDELRVLGRVQLGLTDMVGLMLTVGPTVLPGTPRATALLGPVLSFDALTWVPRIYVAGGLTAGRAVAPLAQLGVELQRFVSLHSALTLGVAGEWSGRRSLGVQVSLGAALEL
jgi:hypothetical protein